MFCRCFPIKLLALVCIVLSCSEDPTSINEVAETVTDIDGNTYKTVKIGNHVWMAENLKVTHYRNGESIPNVTDGSEWGNLSSGAYCSYNNDGDNIETYGLLYNWYAVNDSREISPAGWHVPSDDEWKILEMHLGMSQSEADDTGWRGTDEGGKMKTTGTIEGGDGLWFSPNTGATNESGFSALPGGGRNFGSGGYLGIGITGLWWSASLSNRGLCWYRFLYHKYSDVRRDGSSSILGLSVRCVRD